jgi:hypothetical protein
MKVIAQRAKAVIAAFGHRRPQPLSSRDSTAAQSNTVWVSRVLTLLFLMGGALSSFAQVPPYALEQSR